MSTQGIIEFCNIHSACAEGRKWAIANCDSMHDVWLKAQPDWLVWIATRQGVLPERDLRLFACWCARQVWHLLKDDRSKNAVIVAEKYAVGEATADELAAACAVAAAAAAEWVSANAAEWAAANAAARAATLTEMHVDTWSAKAAKAEYLRERFNPFLKEGKK